MQQRTQRDHKKLVDEMQIAMAQRALCGMAYPASAYRLCNTHESRDTGYVNHKSASQIDSGCKLVYLRVLTVEDLFDEFFAPIPRDGCAATESGCAPDEDACQPFTHSEAFRKPCVKHADRLLKHTNSALALQEVKNQLRPNRWWFSYCLAWRDADSSAEVWIKPRANC